MIVTTETRCFDPSHRSYSSDQKWDECQFMADALARKAVKETLPAKVAVGSAVDFVIKERLLGRTPDVEGEVRRYIKALGSPSAEIDEATEKANSLLLLWEEEVRPGWESVGVYGVEVEEHFEVDGVIYHVHIDTVLNDGSVRDTKTSDQRLGVDRAVHDVQLSTYATAIWLVYDHLPPSVGLDGLINAKMPPDVAQMRGIADKARPKPWFDQQTSTRTVEQLQSWLASARRREHSRAYAKVSGVYQTQGRSSAYACNGCPALSICPEWVGWEGLVQGSINYGNS